MFIVKGNKMIRDIDFNGKLIFECKEILPLDRGYRREILYNGGIEVTVPAMKIIDKYSQPYLIPERTELIPFTEEEKQFLKVFYDKVKKRIKKQINGKGGNHE